MRCRRAATRGVKGVRIGRSLGGGSVERFFAWSKCRRIGFSEEGGGARLMCWNAKAWLRPG